MVEFVKLMELEVTKDSLIENIRDSKVDVDCNMGINSYEFLSKDEQAELDALLLSVLNYIRLGIIKRIEVEAENNTNDKENK